jgi:hypothetical protein
MKQIIFQEIVNKSRNIHIDRSIIIIYEIINIIKI